ncbi:MAG: hypothetical protein Q9171_007164 [Xanthocarpia ochracea]
MGSKCRGTGCQCNLECYTLLQPLFSVVLRCDFINDLFDTDYDVYTVRAKDDAYESFFVRYHALCDLAANKTPDIQNVTHHQLLRAIGRLKLSTINRDAYVCLLREDTEFRFTLELSETIADLSASTWLMLAIGNFPGGNPYDEPVPWGSGLLKYVESRDSALARTSTPDYLSKDAVKLPQSFTAANLEKIGGIDIHWTSNLADHLVLRDDDSKLFLFEQVSAIQLHIVSATSPYPKDLLQETLRTISLLLPPVLGEPSPWFRREQSKNRLDANLGIGTRLNSSERQIAQFKYWRDRLVLLKRTFDEAEPRTISQLYHDDRRKTQWFTFWVAVLVFVVTVFFGVIQSIASIVQAWASVKALHSQH